MSSAGLEFLLGGPGYSNDRFLHASRISVIARIDVIVRRVRFLSTPTPVGSSIIQTTVERLRETMISAGDKIAHCTSMYPPDSQRQREQSRLSFIERTNYDNLLDTVSTIVDAERARGMSSISAPSSTLRRLRTTDKL